MSAVILGCRMAERPDNDHVAQPLRILLFTRAAGRGFRRMPKSIEDAIREKLGQLAAEPNSLANNVKALKGGEGRFRLRVGDYRAIFTIEAIVSLFTTSGRVARSIDRDRAMTIVRTTTPSGEAIVIVPEAEFERLRELAEDRLDASQARLAAGDEELLSEADLDALRTAPTPLAFWRAQEDVARRARWFLLPRCGRSRRDQAGRAASGHDRLRAAGAAARRVGRGSLASARSGVSAAHPFRAANSPGSA